MSRPVPLFCWRKFHLPKQGHLAGEYEDACAGDTVSGRFAVADGASESSFASSWAKILVQAFVHKPGPWSSWLPAARKRWRSRIDGSALPWYTEVKYQEGAYAAFLGVHIEDGRFQAEAVGDCCLFQMRDGKLRRAFPLRRSKQFDNTPNLLGSRGLAGPSQRLPVARVRRRRLESDWHSGDWLFIMTDALAHWFLARVEARQQPWSDLLAIDSRRQFVGLIERLRNEQELRNDDVTLLCIEAAQKKFGGGQ